MNRRECIKNVLAAGVCCGMLPLAAQAEDNPPAAVTESEEFRRLRMEKEFIANWLTDLLDTMEVVLDEETRVRLMEGCGKGCYNRWTFKQDIARDGKGDLEKLMTAYRRNFEIWKDGDYVHVRFGERSKRCYCPAAAIREPKPNDLHCECTRGTHEAIFAEAMGYPVKFEILQTLRRGGQTCHFRAKI
jgi:hypothetical protein